MLSVEFHSFNFHWGQTKTKKKKETRIGEVWTTSTPHKHTHIYTHTHTIEQFLFSVAPLGENSLLKLQPGVIFNPRLDRWISRISLIFLPSINRIFHEYLFTYVSTLHTRYIHTFEISFEEERNKKKEEEEEEEEIDSKSWNSIYEGYFTGTQKWRATWSGIFDGEEPRSTSIQRQTDSLSSGSPLRSAWSRRSSGFEGARFSCGSRSFRGKVGAEKGARERHARRGRPRRVLEKRGPWWKMSKIIEPSGLAVVRGCLLRTSTAPP